MKKLSRDLVHHFEVSFDFIDAGGVVYHPKYYILLERARYDYCGKLGLDLIEHFRKGFVFVVAELAGKYRLPLRVAEPYGILTVAERGSSRSHRVKQYIVAKDKIDSALEAQDKPAEIEKIAHFTGSLHLVHVDMHAMKSIPIPRNFVETFKEYLPNKEPL